MIGSPRLRVAVRLAARDARRSPGRSLLVVALIALPVFALSAADVLYRTMQLSAAEKADRTLGRAQALVSWNGGGTVLQTPDGQSGDSSGGAAPPPTAAALARFLPPASRIIVVSDTSATWRTAFGLKSVRVTDLPYRDAAVAGLYDQTAGRAPAAPGEVALSSTLARSSGRTLGQTLTDPAAGQVYRVVGIVRDRYHVADETAFLAPGTVGAPPTPAADVGHRWFVDSGAPVTWAAVVRMNRAGFWVTSRDVARHPPARADVPYYVQQDAADQGNRSSTIAIAAVLAGMILLEIVLLAGPAFAVGARRSRRTLGLIAAVGGTRADLRNVVLAGGIVLGAAAGLAGLVGGAVLALALLPTAEGLNDTVAGHLDLRPLELGTVAAVSVLTGLLAAWLPARAAARTDVLAALRGRRGTVRTPKRVPVLGSITAATGAVVAIGGSAATGSLAVLLVGAIIAELGLIACTPAILGLVGRAARWLPLSGRIAVRDTARNRSAAASAVAAVMAAVTGAVAASIYVATLDAHDRAGYQQGLPMNAALVTGQPTSGDDAQVAQRLEQSLPATGVTRILGVRSDFGPDATSFLNVFPRSAGPGSISYGALPPVMFDDGTGIDTIAGRPVPAARAALRRGQAVVFRADQLQGGMLELSINNGTIDRDGNEHDHEVTRRVGAVLAPSTYPRAEIVLPPALATTWRLPTQKFGYLVLNRQRPTDRQIQATEAVTAELGLYVNVETGYHDDYSIGLLALLGAAALITLGAATIATALATVDSRPDLATLAAIGASPRVRRRLSAARAGVIALLGCTLGVICGFVAPLGFIGVQNVLTRRRGTGSSDLLSVTIPWWPNIIGALVLVPLLAMAGGFVLSRSRLPVERAGSKPADRATGAGRTNVTNP